jgi:hypothetical protein
VAVYSMASNLVPADQRGRATMLVALGEIGGAPAAFALGGLLLVVVDAHPRSGWCCTYRPTVRYV